MSNYYEMIIDDETKRILNKLKSIKKFKPNQNFIFSGIACVLLTHYIEILELENEKLRKKIKENGKSSSDE